MPYSSFDSISTMPQMKVAFSNWTSKITLTKVTQVITRGIKSTTEENFSFDGVVQPLSPEEIQLKPEGQRAWQWLQIHALTGVNNLRVSDLIKYNNVQYKVMAVIDYSLNGYMVYEIIKDYMI